MPATATKKRIIEVDDPRERLTREIRELLEQHDAAKSRINEYLGEIYLRAYQWCGVALSLGKAKNLKDAHARLAATIKRSSSIVESWYYCGELMTKHDWRPAKVDHRSVRELSMYGRRMKRHAFLGVASMIGNGEQFHRVRSKIHTSADVRYNSARVAAARRAGKDPKLATKLECHVVKHLADRAWPDSKIEVAVYVNGEEVIVVE